MKEPVESQIIGSIVEEINDAREKSLETNIHDLNYRTHIKVEDQNESLEEALGYVENVRSFLKDPSKILGSEATKHGEVAEQIEVGIRNARDVVEGKIPSATFEGVGRTAPEDYIVDNNQIQSKFINGSNNTLNHVINHMEKYEDFKKDGTIYHIPKDQYEIMEKIKQGKSVEGLSQKSIDAIKEKINKIEELTGKPFEEKINPSVSSYKEVQLGNANETLNNHEENLKKINDEKVKDIEKEKSKEKIEIEQQHSPSLKEATKIGAIAAVVSGTISLGSNVYKKYKEKGSFSDFTAEDYREIGLEVGKDSSIGAIKGFAIYGMTNFTSMSAPLAAAVTSSTIGITKLYDSYKRGEITQSEFVNQSQVLCFETGMVTIGATLGQALIPIPVLGSVIGSIATKFAMDIVKNNLGEKEKVLISAFEVKLKNIRDELSKRAKLLMISIDKKFEEYSNIMDLAFNYESNAEIAFNNSSKLARKLGVEESKILNSMKDIDNFFN